MSFQFQTKPTLPPTTAPSVMVENVTFKNRDMKVAGHLYSPKEKTAGKKYAAIVVGHPFNGVKEQTSGLHAALLAELGYVTLAYDATHYGESGGEPRQEEVVSDRVEDYSAALDFLTTLDYVDVERIGVLGVCAGGGYTLKAVQSDKRFKAVATLSMFNSGEVRRNGFQNSLINTIHDRLLQATKARAQEVAGGEIMYSGVASITDEEIAKTPTDLYREGYTYYYRNYSHPNSTFLYTTSSLLDLMTWDATNQIELITQPLLMIAGSKADTKYMTDEAFAKAINAKNKELFLIEGATHIQTYWKPEFVKQIEAKLSVFFNNNL